jgi:hypothetical protein
MHPAVSATVQIPIKMLFLSLRIFYIPGGLSAPPADDNPKAKS